MPRPSARAWLPATWQSPLQHGPLRRNLRWLRVEPGRNSNQWILSVAARAKCPRCGRGKLFNGFLTLAKRCEVCGLDLSFADTADGPAFFAMMGMSVPVTAFALWFEFTYDPPFWQHLVTTLPLLLLLCILPLRFLKGALVASQFVHKAEEGRLADRKSPPG
jgi:uncharacterized protein (DUF983 family)